MSDLFREVEGGWEVNVHADEVLGEEFEPTDRTVPGEARGRLSRQCELILERLRRGPALNAELAEISLKYTSRISDLRKAGYCVLCQPVDVAAGTFRYELVGGAR
jgi:hypothetical protein